MASIKELEDTIAKAKRELDGLMKKVLAGTETD